MTEWKSLGTPNRLVEIVPYTSEWPRLFEREAKRILHACGAVVPVVEHIGSTAIPGLPAKPILDIMPGVVAYKDGLNTIEPLEQLGYEYFGDNGIPGRYYFRLLFEQRTVVHIHMFEIGTGNWLRHLIFRDYLRANPAVAAQYAELKKELAVRFRNDREAYTDAKSEFINSVVQNARKASQEG